jgi:tetratricopeptide (TPR) repeat protein
MNGVWVRVGLLGGALVVAALAAQAFWQRYQFRLARSAIDRGEYAAALDRLESLAASRYGWIGSDDGALLYWLGQCRLRAGRRAEALLVFDRVPDRGEYGARAAAAAAEGLLGQGRWRAAEERLERALAAGPPGLEDVCYRLDQLYRMQARFADAARLLREGCASARDPVRVLRALWRTDRGTPPYDTIIKALDVGARLNPQEDRVWLGRARVATQTGRLEEADTWLKRCAAVRADEPVRRASLEWARAADRPETAGLALRAIGRDRLSPLERLAWRAWLAQRDGDAQGERRALEASLELEPRDPVVLDRLATLAIAAGDSERAAAWRKAKVQVDRDLDIYNQQMISSDPVNGAAARLALARLAEAIGRRFDARVWTELALRAEPGNSEARAALARLGQLGQAPTTAIAILSDPDPWDTPLTRTAGGNGSAVFQSKPAIGGGLRFVDDALASGLKFTFRNGETPIRQMPVALSGGVALVDYDGDGWLDVYGVQGGPFPPPCRNEFPAGDLEGRTGRLIFGDRLFRNTGHGKFQDVTKRAGLAKFPGGYGHGVAVGDVDNDGWPDLFVTRWRAYALYRNRGDGSFDDVTQAWGLGGDRDWPTSAAFADFDGDGDLDLYVCHYVVWDADNPRVCRNESTHAYISCNPQSCSARRDHVFRNDGQCFTDVTAEAGIVDRDGRGLGVIAADFDDDAKIDVFVANDKSANFFFHNLGSFRFEEVGESSGLAASADGGYKAGMGVACGDVNGDGLLDLAVTNFYGESMTLYQNAGSGFFTDRTVASGLGQASRLLLGFGVVCLDADNDGWLDLLTANGHTDDLGEVPYRMPAQLLVGLGAGRLLDRTGASGPALAVPRLGRGMAAGDLDNDGRIDAVLIDQNMPLVWLRNRTEPAGHWVAFRLEGRRSNRDGVGARIALQAAGRRQLAQRFGGGSYQSASDPRLHFGLGKATRVDSLEVRWPSGQIDHYRDLEADQVYHLREGDLVAKPFRPVYIKHPPE